MTYLPLRLVQDLWHIGVILGVEGCNDKDYELDMTRELAKANRKASAEFQKLKETGEFVKKLTNSELALPAKKEQLAVYSKHVAKLRAYFRPNVIRRDIKSVDFEGKPISGLEKYSEIVLMLRPYAIKEQLLEENAEEVVSEYKTSLLKVAKDLGSVSANSFAVFMCELAMAEDASVPDGQQGAWTVFAYWRICSLAPRPVLSVQDGRARADTLPDLCAWVSRSVASVLDGHRGAGRPPRERPRAGCPSWTDTRRPP